MGWHTVLREVRNASIIIPWDKIESYEPRNTCCRCGLSKEELGITKLKDGEV